MLHKILIKKEIWEVLKNCNADAETLSALSGVYIKPNNTIVATNGKILLEVSGDSVGVNNVPEGNYFIETAKKGGFTELVIESTEDEFPKYKQYIPEKKNFLANFKLSPLKGKDKFNNKKLLTEAIIQIYEKSKRRINLTFLEILTKLDINWDLYIEDREALHPIRLEGKIDGGTTTITVVILPYREE